MRQSVGDARVLNNSVLADVCKLHGLTSHQMLELSRGCRVNGGERSHVSVFKAEPAKRHKKSGFHEFWRVEFQCAAKVGTDAHKVEAARVRAKWHGMTPEEHAVWDGDAAAADTMADNYSTDSTYANAVAAAKCLARRDVMRVKRRLALDIASEVGNHPAWSRGLQTFGPSTALKPGLVMTGHNASYFVNASCKLFDYDDRVSVNPPAGSSQPIRSCHARLHGLCADGVLTDMVSTVVYNFHIFLKMLKFSRITLPALCCIQAQTESTYVIVCEMIGKGETQTTLLLDPVEENHVYTFRCEMYTDKRVVAARMSQKVFLCMLEKCMNPTLIDNCRARCFSFKPVQHSAVPAALCFRIDGCLKDCMLPTRFREVLQKKGGAGETAPVVEEKQLPFIMSFLNSCKGDSGADHEVETDNAPHPGPSNPLDINRRRTVDDDDDTDSVCSDDKRNLDAERELGGHRIGIVGYDYSSTSRSRCWVCATAGVGQAGTSIRAGELKFVFRLRAGQLEKSVHSACVVSGAVLRLCTKDHHVPQSISFLSDAHASCDNADTKDLILTALTMFHEHQSGAASGSGGSGSTGSGAAPSIPAPASGSGGGGG